MSVRQTHDSYHYLGNTGSGLCGLAPAGGTPSGEPDFATRKGSLQALLQSARAAHAPVCRDGAAESTESCAHHQRQVRFSRCHASRYRVASQHSHVETRKQGGSGHASPVAAAGGSRGRSLGAYRGPKSQGENTHFRLDARRFSAYEYHADSQGRKSPPESGGCQSISRTTSYPTILRFFS